MLSFRRTICHNSILGIFLFLVLVGSYGLVFIPDAGIFRSLIVLLVFLISLCSLVLMVRSFFSSALLASYQILVLFSVALYLFFSFLNGYEVEVSRILLWISASIWAALLWSNVPFLLDWYSRALYFITIITLVLVIFFGGGLEVYTSTSRNYWSLFLVPLLGGLFLLKYIRSERVGVCLCFLVFLIAVLTQGRSGIISSGIIFFSAVLYNLRFMSGFLSRFFVLSGVLIAFILVFLFALVTGLFDYALARGLGDQARSNIIYEYVFHLDGFASYVSGVSIYLIESARELDYNLHNTFLYFHSRFGVYFFLLIFLVFFALLRALINRSWVLFLVIFSICIRFSTDSGWGINSISIHFLCIYSLGWILSAYYEGKGGPEVCSGNKKIEAVIQ